MLFNAFWNIIRIGAPIVLIAYTWFLPGCAGSDIQESSLLNTGAPIKLPEKVTLLPALDSRKFQEDYIRPVLTRDTAIILGSDEIMKIGLSAWNSEGLADFIIPYNRPFPEQEELNWAEFPLYGLKTDLSWGLEIKTLSLKKTGHNALLVPHAVIDAALLPVFGLAVLVSEGHFDIGGRIIPSTLIKYAVRIDLNVLSKRGGGVVFGKTYLVDYADPGVSETELYKSIRASQTDGQTLAAVDAPILIARAFKWMARDPELSMLSGYAEAAWLARVLTDERIAPQQKINAVNQVARDLKTPDFTIEELDALTAAQTGLSEKMDSILRMRGGEALPASVSKILREKNVDPVWLESQKGFYRLFHKVYDALLTSAAVLENHKMSRPLSNGEKKLEDKLFSLLTLYNKTYTGSVICRKYLDNDSRDPDVRKVCWLLLSRDLENMDNEDFIQGLINKYSETLNQTDGRDLEAVSFFLTVLGEASLDDYPIAKEALYKMLSGRDSWAGPMVVSQLKSDNWSPEIIRLSGALSREETIPLMLDKLRYSETMFPADREKQERPIIPVLPTAPVVIEEIAKPNPALLVKALSCFGPQPDILDSLKRNIWLWAQGGPVNDATAAEAILALGRIDPTGFRTAFLETWTDLYHSNQAPLVRRAALKALEAGAGNNECDHIIRTISPAAADPSKNHDRLREAIGFLGRVRYDPAAPMLGKLAGNSSAAPSVQQAAYHALGLIASPGAEKALNQLVADPLEIRAVQAEKALDELIKERFLWEGLANSTDLSRRNTAKN